MQSRNILRWISAAIIALLAAYLRMTGYLPGSGQEAAYEDQAAEESEYDAGSELHNEAEGENDAAAGDQAPAEIEYSAVPELHTEEEEELYASLNPSYVNAPFYSNHDMDRGAEYYAANDAAKVKIAEALNLLMTGNAFIYYGEELGMKGAGRDENRRAPMYWTDDSHAAGMCSGPAGLDEIRMEYGSLEKQADDPDSIFNYIREAVRIRESLPAIARGRTVRIPELEQDCFCGFLRTYPANQGAGDVLILINTGDTAVRRRLPDWVAEYRNLCAALYTGVRNPVIDNGEITVPAGGILFLQKQN